MGCLCSLLKALTSTYSPSQSLNPVQLEKQRILREEARKNREKELQDGEYLIESKRDGGKEHFHLFRRREPNTNIIRSSSQISSSSVSLNENDGDRTGSKNEEESKNYYEYPCDSKVLAGSNNKYVNVRRGSSITSASNLVDHNFPSHPTFVHRAPSLRHHHSKSGSKSICSSVDCVSSNTLETSSDVVASCSSDCSSTVQVPPNLMKVPTTQTNKRVTFCERDENIE